MESELHDELNLSNSDEDVQIAKIIDCKKRVRNVPPPTKFIPQLHPVKDDPAGRYHARYRDFYENKCDEDETEKTAKIVHVRPKHITAELWLTPACKLCGNHISNGMLFLDEDSTYQLYSILPDEMKTKGWLQIVQLCYKTPTLDHLHPVNICSIHFINSKFIGKPPTEFLKGYPTKGTISNLESSSDQLAPNHFKVATNNHQYTKDQQLRIQMIPTNNVLVHYIGSGINEWRCLICQCVQRSSVVKSAVKVYDMKEFFKKGCCSDLQVVHHILKECEIEFDPEKPLLLCSNHFVSGKPTLEYPFPILAMFRQRHYKIDSKIPYVPLTVEASMQNVSFKMHCCLCGNASKEKIILPVTEEVRHHEIGLLTYVLCQRGFNHQSFNYCRSHFPVLFEPSKAINIEEICHLYANRGLHQRVVQHINVTRECQLPHSCCICYRYKNVRLYLVKGKSYQMQLWSKILHPQLSDVGHFCAICSDHFPMGYPSRSSSSLSYVPDSHTCAFDYSTNFDHDEAGYEFVNYSDLEKVADFKVFCYFPESSSSKLVYKVSDTNSKNNSNDFAAATSSVSSQFTHDSSNSSKNVKPLPNDLPKVIARSYQAIESSKSQSNNELNSLNTSSVNSNDRLMFTHYRSEGVRSSGAVIKPVKNIPGSSSQMPINFIPTSVAPALNPPLSNYQTPLGINIISRLSGSNSHSSQYKRLLPKLLVNKSVRNIPSSTPYPVRSRSIGDIDMASSFQSIGFSDYHWMYDQFEVKGKDEKVGSELPRTLETFPDCSGVSVNDVNAFLQELNDESDDSELLFSEEECQSVLFPYNVMWQSPFGESISDGALTNLLLKYSRESNFSIPYSEKKRTYSLEYNNLSSLLPADLAFEFNYPTMCSFNRCYKLPYPNFVESPLEKKPQCYNTVLKTDKHFLKMSLVNSQIVLKNVNPSIENGRVRIVPVGSKTEELNPPTNFISCSGTRELQTKLPELLISKNLVSNNSSNRLGVNQGDNVTLSPVSHVLKKRHTYPQSDHKRLLKRVMHTKRITPNSTDTSDDENLTIVENLANALSKNPSSKCDKCQRSIYNDSIVRLGLMRRETFHSAVLDLLKFTKKLQISSIKLPLSLKASLKKLNTPLDANYHSYSKRPLSSPSSHSLKRSLKIARLKLSNNFNRFNQSISQPKESEWRSSNSPQDSSKRKRKRPIWMTDESWLNSPHIGHMKPLCAMNKVTQTVVEIK